MSQTIIFTALPHTDKANKTIVSAHVSIQLQGGSSLKDFPDIKQWATKMNDAQLALQLANGTEIKGTLQKAKLDAAKYSLLFTDGINVKNYDAAGQDLTLFPIKSYPVKHINGFIEKAFFEVGNAKSDELPNEVFFTDQWKGLNPISNYSIKDVPPQPGRQAFKESDLLVFNDTGKEIADIIKKAKVMPFKDSPLPAADFAQLRNFFNAKNNTNSKPPALPKPDFEYHDILSVLSSYPLLQRRFGLVLDIEIAAADVAKLGASGSIRVIPKGVSFSQKTIISCPATSYVKTANGFYAQANPTGSVIDKGMLKINTKDFTVVQYDTDGAALKLCNQVDNLQQLKAKHMALLSQAKKAITYLNQQEYENNSQRNEGLPTLRSAGIGIAKNGLANDLFKKFDRNKKLNDLLLNAAASDTKLSAGNAEYKLPAELLYADDLVQGYRMDIADYNNPGKGWFSLHRRLDTYQYAKQNSNVKELIGSSEEDEGFIQLGVAQEQTGDKAMALGEVFARWEGWSLSVRKPGLAINNPGEGKDVNDDMNAEKNKYMLPGYLAFRLEVDSKIVKGSLPKLRFGNEYNVKVRTVDLAGNSLPFDKVPENHPVAIVSRIKYRRFEPTPAPVLLQANEIKDGESVERMVVRSNVGVASADYENGVKDKKKFPPVATRHVLAPRNTQHIAEMHDMFDGIGMNKTTQQNADYTFINDKDLNEFINPDHEGYKQIGRTVYNANDKNVQLTYLADPMAAGVVFFLDKQSDYSFGWSKEKLMFCSFYHDEELAEATMDKAYDKTAWRSPKSFRVELREGVKRPEWVMAERKLVVYLNKAVMGTLNYASFWRPADVAKLSGIQTIVVESGNADTKRNARQSKHWMISPWRQLTLVHATQQPLEKPAIKELKTDRKYNDTTSNLHTRIAVHGKSTDKINFEAWWIDFVDDFADIAPKFTSGTSVVTVLPTDYFNESLSNGNVSQAGTNEKKGHAIVHQWNDTKHRWVFYRPVATSRYREYFTNLVNEALKNKTAFPLTQEGDYFKTAETDPFNALNNGKINILSSARPAAPQVEYVIPSFNWAKNKKGTVETHIRSGNIRVYLKRPWYSSGEGERLGVVLTNAAFSAETAKYFTLWGRDPVFVSGDLNGKNHPTADKTTFPLAADYDTKASMAEVPGSFASVAAYNVLYDADRQLYYADIPINTYGSYFPFIKLALCRYQRDSLRTDGTDCCMSNIVHTDWIQIVPPRTVMTNADRANNRVGVAVSGTSSFIGVDLPTVAHNRYLKSRIKIVIEDTSLPKTDEAFIRTQNREINTVVLQKEFDITNDKIANGQLAFSTIIDLPAAYKTQPYRVIVEEYELHLADPLRLPKYEPGVFASEPSKIKERLVFMDVFEVQ